jgi:hypothetical protein
MPLSGTEIRLPYQFKPRSYQKGLFYAIRQRRFTRAVAVWHRRAGKDKTLVNLISAMAHVRVGAYYYFFPSYAQGRKILWDGIDRDGFPFMGHIPKELRQSTNNTEMKIKLRNGSLIQVVGSDNIDTIVGTNPVGCVFSEYALQDPRGWDFVRPILRENQGWAAFNYTPRGHNHGYDLYRMARSNPDWFCEVLTITDTGVMAEADVQAERAAGMDEELILQEFYCSFDAAIPGAYYAAVLRQARSEGRIGDVPIDRSLRVWTFWDLGMDDSTAIWFVQFAGRECRAVDYYEYAGEGLEHYFGVLDKKAEEHGWMYGGHVAPHDIQVRELGTGKSRWETAASKGVRFQVSPKIESQMDGIEAVRRVFPKCWFDETRCGPGLDALANYRAEWDDKHRVARLRPLHDWSSHGSKAFETFAVYQTGAKRFKGLDGAFS